MRLPKIKFEDHHVCIIACVYVQYVLSCSPNPFCRDRNILEYKSFDSACAFKSKALHVCVRYEVSVKVSYQSGQKQEHRVFRHERFWQSLPAKAVVHVVQYTLSTATLVVILHDVTVCRSRVYCMRQHPVEFLHNWKYATKRCEFLGFYLYSYLCTRL